MWLQPRKGGLEGLSARPFCRLGSGLPREGLLCLLVQGSDQPAGRERLWGMRSRGREGGAIVGLLSTF